MISFFSDALVDSRSSLRYVGRKPVFNGTIMMDSTEPTREPYFKLMAAQTTRHSICYLVTWARLVRLRSIADAGIVPFPKCQ